MNLSEKKNYFLKKSILSLGLHETWTQKKHRKEAEEMIQMCVCGEVHATHMRI